MVVNQVGLTYQKATSEAEWCRFLEVGEAERGDDDDLSSLALVVEGQMARFVTKTLSVQQTSCTNVTDLGTEGVVAISGEVSFDN